ncbi:MAG TPA: hypothetical protein VL285_02300 [Bryobacteraceae bacterium]|nr:hypothetical protein [Bryobacteraceae bacterium]
MAVRAFLVAVPFVLQAAGPKPLKITEAAIHQTEDGPLPPPGTLHVPGEVIFFSCRLEGFEVSPEKKVSLTYNFAAVDPGGVPLAEPASGKIEVELSPQDKEWKPKIRQNVLIPPLAESGTYKLNISVKDQLSGSTGAAEVPFEVRGHAVEPADSLVIRNFRFLRTEEDAAPLKIAAYRPGDAVWARFDITGYKFGPGNQREVAYTVQVSRADGRVLMPPGEPSVDKGSSFYPMRYAPSAISFAVQPKTPPGEYTVLISAQDRIGQQTCELKQTFQVE